MNKICVRVVLLLWCCGCGTTSDIDPIRRYKLADAGKPQQLYLLPRILALAPPKEEPPGAGMVKWWNWDEEKWKSQGKKLTGKSIDDVIQVFGEDYLIVLDAGRESPKMFYRFAGTMSWAVHGVVVLDANLKVVKFTYDGS